MPKGHKYTPEQIYFLEVNISGRNIEELTKLFNKRFRLKQTYSQIRAATLNRGLRNGLHYNGAKHKIYTEEHIRYLRKIVPGRSRSESLTLFNERFGFSLNTKAFSTLYKKHGIQTGFTGYFLKDHVPFNKGKKGHCAPGSEKGWFKKGNKPANWRPVGSERVTVDGYVEIKVTNKPEPGQKRWRLKHVVVFEKANGQVPEGHCVIFLDGNRQNITLNNLCMISREIHSIMCHMNLFTSDPEATMANCLLVANKVAIANLKRKSFTNIKTSKKMIFVDNTGQKIVVAQYKDRYVPARRTQSGLKRMKANLKSRATFEDAQRDLYEYAMKRGWMRI